MKTNDLLIQQVSNELESYEDQIIFTIPSGIITNNPLLNNLGPKIPVKLQIISEVLSNVNTKVINYGINNCLITLTVSIEVTAKVVLPILSDEIKVTNEIPISYKIINGSIPIYYGGSIEKTYGNIVSNTWNEKFLII